MSSSRAGRVAGGRVAMTALRVSSGGSIWIAIVRVGRHGGGCRQGSWPFTFHGPGLSRNVFADLVPCLLSGRLTRLSRLSLTSNYRRHVQQRTVTMEGQRHGRDGDSDGGEPCGSPRRWGERPRGRLYGEKTTVGRLSQECVVEWMEVANGTRSRVNKGRNHQSTDNE